MFILIPYVSLFVAINVILTKLSMLLFSLFMKWCLLIGNKTKSSPSSGELFVFRQKEPSPVSDYAPKNIFRLSSTFVMPPIPNFSTNTFVTFGDRKAGSVGPK